MSSTRLVPDLPLDQRQLADFCRRHEIRRLAVFGSALRQDCRPDSDLDLLVEFRPGARVGLIRLAGMERELSRLLNRKVDLRTAADLSRYFREHVVRTALVQYVEAG